MPIALVSSDDEKNWHRERARRVTKTRATQLTNPSISTFQRIHEPQDFKGNEATRRGHRLEPQMEAWVLAKYGIPKSQILYAHPDQPMHAATPDCALEDEGEWLVVELKTTVEDWSAGLPRKIIRDVLWQRYVMGASWSAVVWWQVDENGVPLAIEPQAVEVEPDPHELQRMIDGANAYLAWVDAGCPTTDEASGLPLEIVEAVELVNAGRAAEARIRDWCDRGGEEVNKTLPGGSIRYTVTESTSFDKAAFLSTDPESAEMVRAADAVLKNAQKDPDFRKPTVRTSLTIAPPKEEQEAA
ncbi:hypothetical protein [Microbacterium sp. MMO-10]|uniref:hypothetical protein n=1 Tax=Microbacterium sp. MMO-10 TaxID=3081272 RepID=UPI00301796FD